MTTENINMEEILNKNIGSYTKLIERIECYKCSLKDHCFKAMSDLDHFVDEFGRYSKTSGLHYRLKSIYFNIFTFTHGLGQELIYKLPNVIILKRKAETEVFYDQYVYINNLTPCKYIQAIIIAIARRLKSIADKLIDTYASVLKDDSMFALKAIFSDQIDLREDLHKKVNNILLKVEI